MSRKDHPYLEKTDLSINNGADRRLAFRLNLSGERRRGESEERSMIASKKRWAAERLMALNIEREGSDTTPTYDCLASSGAR